MPLTEATIVIVTDHEQLIEFLDQAVTLDYSGPEYDEYWCVNIKPFKCRNCDTVICYACAGAHFIIIWPEKDDEDMLNIAAELKDCDMDPRIVRYNRIIGPCVTFEDAKKHGWIQFGDSGESS
jgi:hypothetical protein